MDANPAKPTWLWYLVAGLVCAAGMAGGVGFILSNLLHLDAGFTRVLVPGEHEVDLPEAGSYTIFHEYHSVLNNRGYSNPAGLPGLQVRVVSRQTGAEVPLASSRTNSNYSLGSRAGTSLLELNVSAPGKYLISADYPGGEAGPQGVLAISRGLAGRILTTVLGSFAIFGATILATVLIAVFTFLKRRKASQQLSAVPAAF